MRIQPATKVSTKSDKYPGVFWATVGTKTTIYFKDPLSQQINLCPPLPYRSIMFIQQIHWRSMKKKRYTFLNTSGKPLTTSHHVDKLSCISTISDGLILLPYLSVLSCHQRSVYLPQLALIPVDLQKIVSWMILIPLSQIQTGSI